MRISIQNKLLIMLVATSMVSITSVSWVAYTDFRDQELTRVTQQLEYQRNARANHVARYFSIARAQVLELSENVSVFKAMRQFGLAVAELETVTLPNPSMAQLDRYYRQDFSSKVADLNDGPPVIEALMPKTRAGRWMQAQYLAALPVDAARPALAGQTTTYEKVHAQLDGEFARVRQRLGFHDILLFDMHGMCIYSASKEIDFGNNILTGAFAQTSLSAAYKAARDSGFRDFVTVTDLTHYLPSMGEPAAFVATPIYEGSELLGVLAAQLPNNEIEHAISGNGAWEKEGLGTSGEVYLVGQDRVLRSDTRFFHENPDGYLALLRAQGAAPHQIERIRLFKSNILEQKIQSSLAEAALRGQTGSATTVDYRGIEVIGAYAPLNLDNLTWGIVAKMNTAEVFKGVNDMGRRIITFAVVLQGIFTLLSLLLARVFTAPITNLLKGSRAVGEGNLDTVVQVRTKDEFSELVEAFNAMTAKLKAKTTEANAALQRTQELLANILPVRIANRATDPDDMHVAEAAPSVSVMMATLVDFDQHTNSLAPEVIGTMLNELVGAFDDAAERLGVEKVKTIGTSYLAVSGLNIPAIDHPQRMMALATELLSVVASFNSRHNLGVLLRVGINTGPVIAGVVGRSKFIYDLWGDTVRVTQNLQHAQLSTNAFAKTMTGQSGLILVTPSTYARVKDDGAFTRAEYFPIGSEVAQPIYIATAQGAT
jgi:class 3 adenylate cyclase